MMKDTLPYLQKKAQEGKLFKRVEMILVNDGSGDGTAKLIQKYSAEYSKDKNVVVRGLSLL
jgi:dolichyl-phosphate beta-glucosyltransferase